MWNNTTLAWTRKWSNLFWLSFFYRKVRRTQNYKNCRVYHYFIYTLKMSTYLNIIMQITIVHSQLYMYETSNTAGFEWLLITYFKLQINKHSFIYPLTLILNEFSYSALNAEVYTNFTNAWNKYILKFVSFYVFINSKGKALKLIDVIQATSVFINS